ncbi:Apolipoprotein C-IV [Dissostichus eleginoides]|uniref:Apolipoprotein C-IV n=1 Tax=Dissostichus eleginoides TaxID=100907 RepID=A0AAD9FCI5_DISEL|nr:Apolipoprotein C-IV [Dissostichus eleginoides]
MLTKELVFGLILLMQACGPLLAETPASKQPNSPGLLQRLAEKTREVKATVQVYGAPVLGFFDTYYEDHIQPVTDSYFQWASSVRSSVWEKIHSTIDNYMPLQAANPTDKPQQN